MSVNLRSRRWTFAHFLAADDDTASFWYPHFRCVSQLQCASRRKIIVVWIVQFVFSSYDKITCFWLCGSKQALFDTELTETSNKPLSASSVILFFNRLLSKNVKPKTWLFLSSLRDDIRLSVGLQVHGEMGHFRLSPAGCFWSRIATVFVTRSHPADYRIMKRLFCLLPAGHSFLLVSNE